MKINMVKITPKNWIIKDKGNDIELFYHNKRPQNNPKKPIILPKQIEIDEKFIEGVGLFLGDGDMNRKDKRHLTFASKDKDIAKHALRFLTNKFKLDIKHMSFGVHYYKENKNIEKEWSSYLNFQKKISTRFSNRHKNECISIQVNSVIFRKIFEIIIEETLNKNYIKNKKLRRGLLRGLFAAEGCIGINHVNKPYINQMTFNLHLDEIHLKDIICNILNKERISYRINERKNGTSLEIITTNWKNYWKLWRLNLFDLCQRKKDEFSYIINDLKVFCIIDEKTRNNFFKDINVKQIEITNLINNWPSTIAHFKKGNVNLTMESIGILQKTFNTNQLKKGIEYLRISSLTKMEEKEFLDFM